MNVRIAVNTNNPQPGQSNAAPMTSQGVPAPPQQRKMVLLFRICYEAHTIILINASK